MIARHLRAGRSGKVVVTTPRSLLHSSPFTRSPRRDSDRSGAGKNNDDGDVETEGYQSPQYFDGARRSTAFSRPGLLTHHGLVLGPGGIPIPGGDSARTSSSAKDRSSSSSASKTASPKPPNRAEPNLPSSFRETYYAAPSAPLEPNFYETNLANQLLVSFLPSHQSNSYNTITRKVSGRESHGNIAVVCPIEGSTHLIRETVLAAAGLVSADVIRIDALKSIGLGSDGDLGNLGSCFELGVNNPIFVTDNSPAKGASLGAGSPDQSDTAVVEDDGDLEGEEGYEEEEDGDEANSNESEHHVISGPFEIAIPFGSGGPGRMGDSSGGSVGMVGVPQSFHGEEARVRAREEREAQEDLFGQMINLDRDNEPPYQRVGMATKLDYKPKPRIILIENATAMSSTFPKWYPALLEALQARRGTHATTLVLSITPSFLHLSPNMSVPTPAQSEEVTSATQAGMPPGLEELMKAMKRMREGRSGGDAKKEEDLWKGSEEGDDVGRRRRLRRRLASFQLGDERALRKFLPPFEENARPDGTPSGMINVDSLMRLRNAGGQRVNTPSLEQHSDPRIWRVVGTLPDTRDEKIEKTERFNDRLELNRLLIRKAVGLHGIRFTNKSIAQELDTDEPKDAQVIQEYQDLRDSFALGVWPWTTLQHLVSIGVGHALARASKTDQTWEDTVISWGDLAEASVAEESGEQDLDKWKESNKVTPTVQPAVVQPQPRTGGKKVAKPKERRVDPLVEKLKKDKTLNNHEKKLLTCIVDHNAVRNTKFEDVAMDDKTKDAVRSTISLPLLYPDAFRSGILAQHASQGVLLYGPPGTGKTHLSRALANESGSRMIAVTPADINDMYVGQSEARTKALFSLARRLSPCIIFIDEAESLLGSRGGFSTGNAAHRQVLTEFMQEMDGLTSADSNRESRISMVAATNRPFDIDEAVLRRLPRRLLIDLPTVKDRETILRILLKDEKLGEDVDLADLAKQTDTYSGSDLKHLCVTAAMDALKEAVPPPWKLAQQQGKSNVATATSPPIGIDDYSGGSLEPEREPVVEITNAPESLPQPLPQASMIMRPIGEKPDGTSKSQDRAAPLHGNDKATSATATHHEQDVQQNTSTASESSRKSTKQTIQLPQRVLRKKHFDQAIKEISPSSAEGGQLDELRKWAAKFGEGGSERGKKSGYGAKFGFGTDADKAAEKESEYGRVRPEENDSQTK